MVQEKEFRRIQTFAIIREQDIAMKKARTLKREQKKLHLDINFKNKQTIKAVAQQYQQGEFARANYLLRHSHAKAKNVDNWTGSYGHKIQKSDNKVVGVSALAQKISMQTNRQKSNFGGKNFSKHASTQSGIQLSHIQGG